MPDLLTSSFNSFCSFFRMCASIFSIYVIQAVAGLFVINSESCFP
nr:MAG TPA: hypothetical protein [Caudoviricetes sp.]